MLPGVTWQTRKFVLFVILQDPPRYIKTVRPLRQNILRLCYHYAKIYQDCATITPKYIKTVLLVRQNISGHKCQKGNAARVNIGGSLIDSHDAESQSMEEMMEVLMKIYACSMRVNVYEFVRFYCE